MRYLTQQEYRKYVEGYGFLSFAKKYGDKYGKKLIDTATKIADDITSIGKLKKKGKNKESRRNLHFTRKKTANY